MEKSMVLVFIAILVVSAGIPLLIVMLVPTGSKLASTTRPICSRKYLGDSFVCVCNSTYCDETPEILPLEVGKAVVITSTQNSSRFEVTTNSFLAGSESSRFFEIKIDTNVRFQKIKGFGGAFTDAASLNLYSLSKDSQENLINSYFSTAGIEYNIGRIPMAGCDFSTRKYTYNDKVDDFLLTDFSLADEDFNYKIPFIQRAIKVNQRQMSFFGSPWTAPAWMKTSNDLVGGKLRPEKEYQNSWSQYFVKFIEEYAKKGIQIWGITVQNEPTIGSVEDFPFQCMGYTAEEEGDFVKNFLGPTLKESGHEDVKIIIGDDQRWYLPEWIETLLNDTEAAEFVSGIGIHWYTNMIAPVSKLDETHSLFPNKFILSTEACSGSVPFLEPKVDLGSWQRGQYYSSDIINNLNHWGIGWVDWNMALDLEGGPNWVKNFVDSPIIVDKTKDEFYKQPMFYHMGHFSKFIEENSTRLEVKESFETRNLMMTAVISPQNDIVTFVVLNKDEKQVSRTIVDANVGKLDIEIPGNSIQTYIWSIKR